MKLRVMLLCLLFVPAPVFSAGEAVPGCIACHGSAETMAAAGYSQLTLSATAVYAQTKMAAACTDCHLGDAAAAEKDAAHAGMPRPRAVTKKYKALARPEMSEADRAGWLPLAPRGSKQATRLGPKKIVGTELKDNDEYRTVLWHDKNPGTLAFNPMLAEKTCGRCHAEQVRTFVKTAMGGAKGVHTQSQYRTWTGSSGPQSCGLWLGVMTEPGQEGFTDENVKLFNAHSTMPVPTEAAFNMQRNCNTCHVGCLDCHYRPEAAAPADAAQGGHTFVRMPDAQTCYGNGRSFTCHAGPLERRRGDGYLKGEYVQATEEGKKLLKDRPDVHVRQGMVCVDCHRENEKTGFHADFRRDVDCARCHSAVSTAQAAGVHRNVDCAACHVSLIGGYAFNFWTVGGEAGRENPATRIQDYLVDAIAPVLVKNPAGNWIPVHPVPHTSGNVNPREVKLSKRLMFRNRPDAAVDRRYRSNDSYAVTGLVNSLDDTDRAVMVWLNVDRVAHGIGKSRSCESCHATTGQTIFTRFTAGSYRDVEEGAYTIVADDKGLRITDFQGPDGGPPAEGLKPFAKKWAVPGNFALPKVKDRARFEEIKKRYEAGAYVH